ncbi:hypothetical protein Tco_0750293 [Tanacetum coccineum]|uniref:Uncharacterized protein n=1 Tax=Tanacetum coccineum TaxID=301880 RepID=A0ABQ4Z3L1_9ASTR
MEGSSKRAGEELERESIKKQKVDEDKETTKLQSLIKVIPDEEEVAIDVIPLATKPLTIVYWKIYKEGKNNYYQIIRANGSSKMYRVFSQMLKSFDRKNLEDLYKLSLEESTGLQSCYVKIYESTCRVFIQCGSNLDIQKLVEKRCPLTPATITDMLNKKLHYDHLSEMVYHLLKLLTKQLKNL